MHKHRKNKMRREAGLLKGFTTYKTHTAQCSYTGTRMELLVSSRQSNFWRAYRTVRKKFPIQKCCRMRTSVHVAILHCWIAYYNYIILSLELGIFGAARVTVCLSVSVSTGYRGGPLAIPAASELREPEKERAIFLKRLRSPWRFALLTGYYALATNRLTHGFRRYIGIRE